jgi:small subunit ribosomal protein S1
MSKEVIKPSQFGKVDPAKLQTIEISDAQRQELQELYGEQSGSFRVGKLMIGTIAEIDSNGIIVDIKYKSNGFVSRNEFSPHEYKDLQKGQEIDVILDELENIDGDIVLSYEKAKAQKAWNTITKLFEENKPVEGIITHTVKGGLSVDIGIPAFLPGSQVDLQRVTDFSQYVGQTITAEIIKLNKKRGNVIISRRKYLADQRLESRKKAMDTVQENQILRGVVKNITNYGVFIDIGGVDGLLHITDMTWGRIAHPSELVKIGDSITVKVLSIDKDNSKISLGIKQLKGNPWENLDKAVEVGSIIKGKISSIADYGLFVEVQEGIEGLVHISEISWTNRVHDLRKHYNVGDIIEAKVVSLDKENRRMSLSVKQMTDNPWKQVSKQFAIGQKIKGTISNITDFGIFIQLIPGVDGLAHISDLSWTRHINHPADIYAAGQEVEAVILSIDEDNKRVSLGIKQLETDPWETVAQDFPVGTIVEGEVSKVVNNNAFIRLANGIEGLLVRAEERPEVGQKSQFRIVDINRGERKLWLSLNLDMPIEEIVNEVRAAKEAKNAAKNTAARPAKQAQQQPAAPVKKKAPAQQQPAHHNAEPVKMTKSTLQLELEKLAAKQQENAESEE